MIIKIQITTLKAWCKNLWHSSRFIEV